MSGTIPRNIDGWAGTVAGAFIGFETLANMGEEVKDPRRTLPRGILGAVGISIAPYLLVVTAVVLSDRNTANPLIGLFGGKGVSVFAVVGALAVGNGVLVQIVMLSRLFYGMATRGQLPAMLAWVHPRTGSPVPATVLAGAIILAVTLAVPFSRLLVVANAITLIVFTLVDLALWRLQRLGPPAAEGFHAPAWVPPVAALLSAVMLVSEILF